jgi:CDP-diacylglycerol---glycerol-3-phosphate 3-phosphatidyltransferase
MKLTIPNQLTILRIILTPIFLYFFLQNTTEYKLIGTIIFMIAGATDWYDGYVARKFNVITRWGQFMDPLADKILISAALCVFAYLGYIYWWMVIVIVVRDFFITFLRMFALHLGKSIVTSYFAKWKTMVQMTAVVVFIIYLNFPKAEIYQLDTLPPSYTHWTSITFLIVTVLTLATGIQYLIENRGHLVELVRRTLKLHN